MKPTFILMTQVSMIIFRKRKYSVECPTLA